MAWISDRAHISLVNLPGDSTPYYIKDAEARDAIDLLSNATHFLGVTTTELTDGATTNPITIGGESVTAVNGDIVVTPADSTTDGGSEFIFDGTKWYKFGDVGVENLGDLAYKNTASSTFTPSVGGSKNTLAVESHTKDSETLPLTFGSTAVDGATSFKAVNTIGNSVTVLTGGSYSKPASATVTVNSSATFNGEIAANTVVTGVTGGVGVLNESAVDLAFVSSANDGTQLVYNVGSTAPVSGTVTIPTTSVYGVASDASILSSATLTAVSTSASTNIAIATVDANETLIISALAFATAATTVQPYDVGAANTYDLASGEATITVNTSSYKTTIAASTFVSNVTAVVPAKSSVSIEVTGNAVTNSAVTFNSWDTVALDTAGQTTTVVPEITTSTIYGTVTTPSWSHTHTLSGDIEVHGENTSVIVS